MPDTEQAVVTEPVPDSGSTLLFKRILIAMLAKKYPKWKVSVAAASKKWRTGNRERVRFLKRRWSSQNPDKINAMHRREWHKNKAKKAEYYKKWRSKPENKAKKLAHFQKSYKANKALFHRKNSEYVSKRRKRDPLYGIILTARVRVCKCAKGLNTRGKPSREFLGCTTPEFRSYLESKFRDGMGWMNYGKGEGKWVVDHIRPVASFDFTKPGQFEKCFHYSNLQPLWWRENMEKRDKYSPDPITESCQ